MIGTLLVVGMAAACTLSALAAERAPLGTLHAIKVLPRAGSSDGIPVAFEATVTYYKETDVDLFVQEGSDAIYIEAKPNAGLAIGDRVLVKGHARQSFTTDIVSDSITVLRHGTLPTPARTTFRQMIHAEDDCRLVTIRATVRSADKANFGNTRGVYLRLDMDEGFVDAMVVSDTTTPLTDLLDAEVEVTGVVSGQFDSKMQLTGILIEVPELSDVRVVTRPKTSTTSLPITPMDQVLASYSVHDLTQRVRVKGTITYYQPGSAVALQDGSKSIWISTRSSSPLRIGDLAEATGFPDARHSYLTLTDGEFQDLNVYAPVPAQKATWRELAIWNTGDPTGHQNDLVSFEGKVAAAVREDAQDEFVLFSDGKLFTAIYRHPVNGGTLPPMRQVPIGAVLRVTGICMAAQASTVIPVEQEVPFNILLRSFDDIEIVAQPPLLNTRNLILLVGFLLLAMALVGARAWAVERKMRQHMAALGYIEQRRSRILEDINGSRPLAEIVEEIAGIVSLKLSGAPCWCQISDGARLGSLPANLSHFRVVEERILGQTGATLGTIYAAIDLLTKRGAGEAQALSAASKLASLAIETRRLYSDLHHRSEFDMLTDIHNRFALDKQINALIGDARDRAGIFGLIYIDLNKFKSVNDRYGHRIGDLYLQEVALRMKRQLRGRDILARLGGDEFAALITVVHARSDVDEIATRLHQSFGQPFVIEGHSLRGSASMGIALYPEDGDIAGSLFTAADAAMYVNKNSSRDDNGDRCDDRSDFAEQGQSKRNPMS